MSNKEKEVKEIFDKVWPRLSNKNFAKSNPNLTRLIATSTLECLWEAMQEKSKEPDSEPDNEPVL